MPRYDIVVYPIHLVGIVYKQAALAIQYLVFIVLYGDDALRQKWQLGVKQFGFRASMQLDTLLFCTFSSVLRYGVYKKTAYAHAVHALPKQRKNSAF